MPSGKSLPLLLQIKTPACGSYFFFPTKGTRSPLIRGANLQMVDAPCLSHSIINSKFSSWGGSPVAIEKPRAFHVPMSSAKSVSTSAGESAPAALVRDALLASESDCFSLKNANQMPTDPSPTKTNKTDTKASTIRPWPVLAGATEELRSLVWTKSIWGVCGGREGIVGTSVIPTISLKDTQLSSPSW